MAIYHEMTINQKFQFILKKILPPKMILCIGINGSGKRTFAKKYENLYGYEHISQYNAGKLILFFSRRYCRLNSSDEKKVSEIVEQKWNKAKSLRRDVIITDCNLKEEYQKVWEKRARDNGYIFIKKYFPIDIQEAWERDSKRDPLSVGREAIVRQYEKWLKLTNRRRFLPNTENPKAVICDIDGTIATAVHRNISDYSQVSTDEPRTDIIKMIMSWVHDEKHEIIFLTGRESSCFRDTQCWIEKWVGVGEKNLFMRECGDFRREKEVIEELFWKHIAENYNVVAVVDDRPQVIRMWHDIGIENVINVQKGYNEF